MPGLQKGMGVYILGEDGGWYPGHIASLSRDPPRAHVQFDSGNASEYSVDSIAMDIQPPTKSLLIGTQVLVMATNTDAALCMGVIAALYQDKGTLTCV